MLSEAFGGDSPLIATPNSPLGFKCMCILSVKPGLELVAPWPRDNERY